MLAGAAVITSLTQLCPVKAASGARVRAGLPETVATVVQLPSTEGSPRSAKRSAKKTSEATDRQMASGPPIAARERTDEGRECTLVTGLAMRPRHSDTCAGSESAVGGRPRVFIGTQRRPDGITTEGSGSDADTPPGLVTCAGRLGAWVVRRLHATRI